jgi:hypothetical protein
MFNFNRTNRNALTSIFVLFVIIVVLGMMRTTSKYQPRPILITPVSEASLFDLEIRLECAPGYTSEGSAYTKSLTPGGLCGAQKLVSDHAGYAIEDGIGGTLI